MYRSVLIVCSLCITIAGFSQRKTDVVGYSYQVKLSDQDDSIHVRALVSFNCLDTASFIILDLANLNNKGKGMIVRETKAMNLNSPDLAPYSHTGDKLIVWFPSILPKGTFGNVSVKYDGIPSDGLIIGRNKFGHRTFFSDNWPNRAHNWIACVDDPGEKATVDFVVEAPSHYRVVANGSLRETKAMSEGITLTHWYESIPLPPKIMVIGAAGFSVKEEGTVGGVPVSTWVYSDNSEKGFYDYAPAKDILAFLIDYIGPFPYEKLANVQSTTIFGGMENAGAIFYNENYVNGKRDQYALMAHEITHQWFGDMATEKKYAHLWLSEGFATCLSILYMENKFGVDTARFMRQQDRQDVIGFVKNWDRPVVDSVTSTMQLLNVNSYQKGGWILHMLRHQLGDSVFKKCIRTYYADYAGKNADTYDLENVFEKVSGKDLSVFFKEWLYSPGIPKLDIKWKYAAGTKKITVTVQQLQKNIFHFPLELLVKTANGSQTQTIQVNQGQQIFSIPARQKPIEIKADAGVNLLFDGTVVQGK